MDSRLRSGWDTVRKESLEGKAKVGASMEKLVEWVQDATGLKAKEALGWGQGVMREAQEKVQDLTETVEKQADVVKVEAHNRSEEVEAAVAAAVDVKEVDGVKRLV